MSKSNCAKRFREYDLPEQIECRFLSYCEPHPTEAPPVLRKLVTNTVIALAAFSDTVLGPNLHLAQELAERYYILLDHYHSFADDKRVLIAAAIKYFSKENDEIHDTLPLLGLDDDVIVLNHVLNRVGREELYMIAW